MASEVGTLFAFEKHSGQVVWQRSIGGVPTSPALDGGNVVVGASTGQVIATDAKTGQPAWEVAMTSPVVGAPDTVDEGLIIAASDGRVTLLDPANGRERWAADLDGWISRSAAVAGGLVIVPLDPGGVAALDLQTGRPRWLTRVADMGAVGTPASDGRTVFAATGLAAGSSARGVVALALATGALRWRYQSPTAKTVYTPAVDGSRAFAVGEDGMVVALDVATGREIWVHQTGEPLEALPAVAGDLLIVAGNNGHLRALDVEDGSEVWSAPIEGVPFAPAVTEGLVLVPSDTGTVLAFGTPG